MIIFTIGSMFALSFNQSVSPREADLLSNQLLSKLSVASESDNWSQAIYNATEDNIK